MKGKTEKIYIVPGNVNSYFLFIHRLFMYGYIKHVSKELQVLIIHPEQVRGIYGEVFVLFGAAQNDYYSEIRLQLQLRSKVLKVHECSPVISQKDFIQLF